LAYLLSYLKPSPARGEEINLEDSRLSSSPVKGEDRAGSRQFVRQAEMIH